jgi:hypothetical protein
MVTPCQLCGKPATAARCDACVERLAKIDADLGCYLPEWRREDGLRYARWAVLDLPPTGDLPWSRVMEKLNSFCEKPAATTELVVMGKRQAFIFFFDTLK